MAVLSASFPVASQAASPEAISSCSQEEAKEALSPPSEFELKGNGKCHLPTLSSDSKDFDMRTNVSVVPPLPAWRLGASQGAMGEAAGFSFSSDFNLSRPQYTSSSDVSQAAPPTSTRLQQWIQQNGEAALQLQLPLGAVLLAVQDAIDARLGQLLADPRRGPDSPPSESAAPPRRPQGGKAARAARDCRDGRDDRDRIPTTTTAGNGFLSAGNGFWSEGESAKVQYSSVTTTVDALPQLNFNPRHMASKSSTIRSEEPERPSCTKRFSNFRGRRESRSSSQNVDIRAVEDRLADQVLLDLGFASAPPTPIRSSAVSPASQELRGDGPGAKVLQCVPSDRTHSPGGLGTLFNSAMASEPGDKEPGLDDDETRMGTLSEGADRRAGRLSAFELFQQQLDELTAEMRREVLEQVNEGNTALSAGLISSSFSIFGLLPSRRCGRFAQGYQWLVLLLVALAALGLVVLVGMERPGLWSLQPTCTDTTAPCWQQAGLLSDVPKAAGAVAGFLLIAAPHAGGRLRNHLHLLQRYATWMQVMARWEDTVWRDRQRILLALVCALSVSVVGFVYDSQEQYDSIKVLHLCCSALLTTVLFTLVYCVMIICRGMTVMVDMFGCRMVNTSDCATAMNDWNVLQAILRKTSTTIEWGFVSLLAVLALLIPALLADFFVLGSSYKTAPALLQNFIILAGIARMLLVASSVTDKCSRVPSLVNALPLGAGSARIRQHIVEYIVHSSAGFYIWEVRMTTELFFKFLYTWSIVAFGISTTLFSSS